MTHPTGKGPSLRNIYHSTPETIGTTGESVEQFEVMSFFERRNNVLGFLQISPK